MRQPSLETRHHATEKSKATGLALRFAQRNFDLPCEKPAEHYRALAREECFRPLDGPIAEARILERQRKAEEDAKPDPACPRCGYKALNKRHHDGAFLVPECTWTECEHCGWESEKN